MTDKKPKKNHISLLKKKQKPKSNSTSHLRGTCRLQQGKNPHQEGIESTVSNLWNMFNKEINWKRVLKEIGTNIKQLLQKGHGMLLNAEVKNGKYITNNQKT